MFTSMVLAALSTIAAVSQTWRIARSFSRMRIDRLVLVQSDLLTFDRLSKYEEDAEVLCSNSSNVYRLLAFLGYDMKGYDGSQCSAVGMTMLESVDSSYVMCNGHVANEVKTASGLMHEHSYADVHVVHADTSTLAGACFACRLVNEDGMLRDMAAGVLKEVIDGLRELDEKHPGLFL